MDLKDISPLAILLVKDGSRGDKLVFKYPYCYSSFSCDDVLDTYEGKLRLLNNLEILICFFPY